MTAIGLALIVASLAALVFAAALLVRWMKPEKPQPFLYAALPDNLLTDEQRASKSTDSQDYQDRLKILKHKVKACTETRDYWAAAFERALDEQALKYRTSCDASLREAKANLDSFIRLHGT
jgi:hypothetical protein